MSNLQCFIDAHRDTYPAALEEIRSGRKRSHWMWFIFPQIKGLGRSETARFYAIDNLQEAQAYLEHPLLGKHLLEISEALLGIEGKSAHEIFGSPDDLKLRSSMTLFAAASPHHHVFQKILHKFFDTPDLRTLEILKEMNHDSRND